MTVKYERGSYRAKILAQGFDGEGGFAVSFLVTGAYDRSGRLSDCEPGVRTCAWPLDSAESVRRLRADLAAAGVLVVDLDRLSSRNPNAIKLAGRTVGVYCFSDGEGRSGVWGFGGRWELGHEYRCLQKQFARLIAEG